MTKDRKHHSRLKTTDGQTSREAVRMVLALRLRECPGSTAEQLATHCGRSKTLVCRCLREFRSTFRADVVDAGSAPTRWVVRGAE